MLDHNYTAIHPLLQLLQMSPSAFIHMVCVSIVADNQVLTNLWFTGTPE